MATNLAVNPDLIEQALKIGGEKTKAATVTRALQEFIARRRQKAVLELAGKLVWDDGYDYKRERSR
jgi:hypothetical protein